MHEERLTNGQVDEIIEYVQKENEIPRKIVDAIEDYMDQGQ